MVFRALVFWRSFSWRLVVKRFNFNVKDRRGVEEVLNLVFYSFSFICVVFFIFLISLRVGVVLVGFA